MPNNDNIMKCIKKKKNNEKKMKIKYKSKDVNERLEIN